MTLSEVNELLWAGGEIPAETATRLEQFGYALDECGMCERPIYVFVYVAPVGDGPGWVCHECRGKS